MKERRQAKMSVNIFKDGVLIPIAGGFVIQGAGDGEAANNSLYEEVPITNGVTLYHNDSTASIVINRFKPEALIPGLWNTIATIPQEYAPNKEVLFMGGDNSASSQSVSFAVQLVVLPSGDIQIWAYPDNPNVVVNGTVTYAYKFRQRMSVDRY